MPEAGAARTTWRQRLLLLAFGGSLPLALELGLRLAGFGGAPPLLLPALPAAPGQPALARVNPALAEPFFARPGRHGETVLGGHRAEVVRVPKPAGTWRVVLVGDSTAEGFPLPRNLTAASFLAERLRRAAGGRDVEVINLGVTAVASYPVREIGLAALRELEPDLLLVYTGHNEFFGAGGVASWQRMGTRPALLRTVYALRRSASFQALAALLGRRGDAPAEALPAQLIATMAAVAEVVPEGPLHEQARRLLEANVRALAAAARERGVPVIVSTVVSNERDLAPLASFAGELPAEDRPSFRRRLEEAEGQVARAPREALAALVELRRRAPRHAGAAYAEARALEALGLDGRAAEGYRQARDLDAMPWRATRAQNEALRRAAAAAGAWVADTAERFAAAARPAPGWDLFFDHLHPNLRGQALLAEAFFAAVVAQDLLPLPAERSPEPADWRELARDLGANELELYVLLGKMGAFFERGPLAANNPGAAAHFRAAAEQLVAGFGGGERSAIELWRAASHRVGVFLPISWFGGAAGLAAGEPERALAYLRAAVASAPPLSEERGAATLLESLALARSGAAGATARLGVRLGEAEREVASGRPPSAVRLRALAGLLALSGLGRRARALDARAEQEAPQLAPAARVYYEGLPAAGAILGAPPARLEPALPRRSAAAPPGERSCLTLTAFGRPGHGGSLDVHAASHRLIGALDRLLELADEAEWLEEVRITSLVGGSAINVKPAVASAEAELALLDGWSAEGVRPGLLAELGRESLSSALASGPCPQGGG